MSVRAYSELSYFSAQALAELGRDVEAGRLFRAILDYADLLLGSTATIDYFATSLSTTLLFEDDLQKRQNALACLMKAQAYYGLQALEQAQEQLALVLVMDPNNAVAIDLANELATEHAPTAVGPAFKDKACNGAVQEQEVVGG
jgi:tetratricopeptide (TPR) repeat protein